MDRCHRIGQTRPVLVFRLATAHSVEGKMLRRAADKMALERLVIKKGAFKDIHSSEVCGGEGGVGGGAGHTRESNQYLLLQPPLTAIPTNNCRRTPPPPRP